MRSLHLALLTLLVCGLAGCSRSQKSGKAISAQDVAKAMPEFILVMPPGATNVYFERVSHSPIITALLKLTVPRASLTNFLTLSSLGTPLLPMPAGTFGRQYMPMFPALNLAGAAEWMSDVRHASEWDPGKGNTPLLMGCIATSAKSSPREQVFMLILVDDSTNAEAKVYLQYFCGPKLR